MALQASAGYSQGWRLPENDALGLKLIGRIELLTCNDGICNQFFLKHVISQSKLSSDSTPRYAFIFDAKRIYQFRIPMDLLAISSAPSFVMLPPINPLA